MKVSLNTVKQYIDFELPPVDELVKRINEQLGGVEEVIDLADKYKDAKIVKVVECEKHPNADRLNVCKIDAGAGELIQVVCGAPNVHADMWAVWLPPESIVPSTYGTDDEFKLGARELRGVMSNGMLAAGDELAINGDHDGIIEINPDEWRPYDVEIKAGASFAEAYGLSDTIIDIENKMFTHRPDLFGQLGVAREIAGILGHKFTSPEWYVNMPEFASAEGLDLEVFNEAGDKVPRIMFAAMKNVEVKSSPLWLQCALVAMGGKAINNIVDVTNYVMLLTAQPTHAYDYDKLRGHKIGARMAQSGEKIELLNGKTYELTEDDIVIADGEGAIGLGGIMGGGNSEVSLDTKNIVLEVATFDMYAARKSSMRHGIFTDALTRFNKGQSPLQNNRIINLLMTSMKDISPAEQASNVFDLGVQGTDDAVRVTDNFINDRLGLKLQQAEIKNLLTNVEMRTELSGDHNAHLEVFSPFWRTDIEQPEDIVEEVGRLYGFDKLPRELPKRSMKPASKNQKLELKQNVRETLSRLGANEVLTYSFVHERTMTRAGQDPKHAYKISNALSPDLQYYRTALMPSLLDKIHMNAKAGYDEFAIFEQGKVHYKGEMDESESDVPNEDSHLAFVLAYGDKVSPEGAPYYFAINYLKQVTNSLELNLVKLADFDLESDEWGRQLAAAYDPNRSAVVVRDGQIWGVVGEFKQSVRKAFKLPSFAAGFEVHQDVLSKADNIYKPLSRYPSVSQDVSLKVEASVPYQVVYEKALKAAFASKPERTDIIVVPVTIYQANEDDKYKTITLRLNVTSHEKTLKELEVTVITDSIAAAIS
ncbi:MAG TPA: phenylalanine--tRNA ligase subunit beta [Candidatus Saccharimonadales bacterium]